MVALAEYISGAVVDSSVRLMIRKGRVVGVCLTCAMEEPGGKSVQELLGWLAAQVDSGYGQVEVIFGADNEVVGCRFEVSYGLESFIERG